MKKTYIVPTAEVIDLFREAPILCNSGGMGTSDNPGFNDPGNVLSNKTIWNYNEDDEK